MQLDDMTNEIMTILHNSYHDQLLNSIDIQQLRNICMLYQNKYLDKIDDSQSTYYQDTERIPKLETVKSDKKTHLNIQSFITHKKILSTKEFRKRYTFFIKIIYSCLIVGIDIFDNDGINLMLKSNHYLLRSINKTKKQIIEEQIAILNQLKRDSSISIKTYENVNAEFILKLKTIDKITAHLDKLIQHQIITPIDNLFHLILPFFYVHLEYIEEYTA